ncbi:HAD family hydrolase [Agromyces archimandritae]|uniref:HAD family phosphatase n=1 Tax=Agromyces archimandritae TaxID=2781962 RepID=A0A975FMJ0_9MICO|nr:HAD family phosphatase [Agromyces archimandritae]QTX05208.1 HAD family phosphatase [Agromyces archimandritae]
MPNTAPAPITLRDAVVVFDYGEVVSLAPSVADQAALIARSGVDPAAFQAAYWSHRRGLDEGTTSIQEYWRLVAADTGADWDEVDAAELWALDHRSWLSVNPEVLRVVRALHDGGTRLAVCSNAAADYGGWLAHGGFAHWFERVFVSGELRLVKPDAAIYEHVMQELGIAPSQFVFIDNKVENVEAARALGGRGHVFTDAGALEAWLRAEAR